jgi:hypothetical protein
MANFILLLAFLCAGTSFVFFTAGNSAGGLPNWASGVCSTANLLCHNPQLAVFAAVGLAGLWLVLKIVSALRG